MVFFSFIVCYLYHFVFTSYLDLTSKEWQIGWYTLLHTIVNSQVLVRGLKDLFFKPDGDSSTYWIPYKRMENWKDMEVKVGYILLLLTCMGISYFCHGLRFTSFIIDNNKKWYKYLVSLCVVYLDLPFSFFSNIV